MSEIEALPQVFLNFVSNGADFFCSICRHVFIHGYQVNFAQLKDYLRILVLVQRLLDPAYFTALLDYYKVEAVLDIEYSDKAENLTI